MSHKHPKNDVLPFRMKWLPCFVPASFVLLSGLGYSADSADSGIYYFKHFSTSSSISPWYSNDNSWGVDASGGS